MICGSKIPWMVEERYLRRTCHPYHVTRNHITSNQGNGPQDLIPATPWRKELWNFILRSPPPSPHGSLPMVKKGHLTPTIMKYLVLSLSNKELHKLVTLLMILEPGSATPLGTDEHSYQNCMYCAFVNRCNSNRVNWYHRRQPWVSD